LTWERTGIFGREGGFILNTIHNIQAGIPAENMLAMLKAINESASWNAFQNRFCRAPFDWRAYAIQDDRDLADSLRIGW
jgi:hypothetical protein